MTRCTGVLFSSFQNEFQSTSAQTGAISSTLSGVLVNRFGCRITAVVGGLMYTVGMIGVTLAQNIYLMYVMSAVVGSGTGVAFAAANVIVAQYFKKYYPLACGITTAGYGLGFVIFGPFIQFLADTYGWRGAMLVTCAITGNVCAAGVAFRPKQLSRKGVTVTADDHEESGEHHVIPTLSTIACRNPLKCLLYETVKLLRLNLLCRSYRFSMLCFAETTFILCHGSYLVYLVPLANSSGIGDQQAALLITAFGVGSFIGVPLSGLLSQKVSTLVLYEVAMFASGCFVLVVQLQTYPFYAISSAMFGLSLGFQYTARQVMMLEFVGVDNLGSALGIFSAIGGVFDLIGPIAAGSLYDASGSFSVVFYVLAGSSFVGFLAMLSIPLLKKIEPGVYTEVAVQNV
ncbi:monocarboxylate transporter 12-like [Patiria miniata]|uniref:Major facilitator superfamily (MFS) profile domain-containing protein n=1 Tax=Patiria miniata TaxID=46514 RepID=A0A914BC63_PATMI|nr:monocarboxylate transporter 12-like [Patiria miniata]